MPPHPDWVKDQVEDIDKEFFRVMELLRNGTIASGLGPFLLGVTTEAAADDYLLCRRDKRAPLGTRSLGQVNGVHLVEVWMYGDPSFVHERLGREVQNLWFTSLLEPRPNVNEAERQRRADLWNVMKGQMGQYGSPKVALYDRRSKPADYCRKEPDAYWALDETIEEGDDDDDDDDEGEDEEDKLFDQQDEMASDDEGSSDDTNQDLEKGAGCAALEVVWRNESMEQAFAEGILWSSLGKIPGVDVLTAHNAIVLFCPKEEGYSNTSDGSAWLVMLFTAADSEGRGAIDAYLLNASDSLLQIWQEVFDRYEPTLHQPVQVHSNVQSVPMTLGFFGPRDGAEAWQKEPFVLLAEDLDQAKRTAIKAELKSAKKAPRHKMKRAQARKALLQQRKQRLASSGPPSSPSPNSNSSNRRSQRLRAA